MFPYSPDTQKSPWITIDGEEISDSQLIIEFLARKFGIDLRYISFLENPFIGIKIFETPSSYSSYKLSPREKGIALSFRHLLEHHFYWIMIVERYVDQEARHLKDIVQKSSENDDEHAKVSQLSHLISSWVSLINNYYYRTLKFIDEKLSRKWQPKHIIRVWEDSLEVNCKKWVSKICKCVFSSSFILSAIHTKC